MGDAAAMLDVAVTVKGDVAPTEVDRVRRLVGELDARTHDPVLSAHAVLREERNPRLERPARAEGELDVNGHLVRAGVAAATMTEAVDLLAARLRRELRDFAERRERLARRPHERVVGEWRLSDRRPQLPAQLRRPAAERAIVRRKVFALDVIDPQQAVLEMLDLDHDFFLFRDAETGREALTYRRDDGRVGLIHVPGACPAASDGIVCEESRLPEPISLASAVAEMDAVSHRFLFFTDSESGRGEVIYLRYDGNYGLIQPVR